VTTATGAGPVYVHHNEGTITAPSSQQSYKR
jgi:hypothetical protein